MVIPPTRIAQKSYFGQPSRVRHGVGSVHPKGASRLDDRLLFGMLDPYPRAPGIQSWRSCSSTSIATLRASR